MGYTAAVGTMLMDEVASLTERADARVEWVQTSVAALERDVDRGHQWSRTMNERVGTFTGGRGGVTQQAN